MVTTREGVWLVMEIRSSKQPLDELTEIVLALIRIEKLVNLLPAGRQFLLRYRTLQNMRKMAFFLP